MSFWHYAKSAAVAKGAKAVVMANRQIQGFISIPSFARMSLNTTAIASMIN